MNKSLGILFTALLLGVAWAIRGGFGHEWGAAWAGAIGGLAIIVAMKRKDWRAHAPQLAFLAAIGWGTGGMMSYGIVIGYCNGLDFWNVSYGHSMLALIGALYGCIGGGMLGLGLASSPEKRPQWASLLTEMVAGAWLSWGFLIYQVELFMTPPRSELWAACFGAAAALLWHLHRHGYKNAFRVALFTALGAGFGFSFGSFIKTMGIASGLSYNWWNVMEFTLGVCGGIGMAYAIYSSQWPKKGKASRNTNIAALAMLFFVIPLLNYFAVFSEKKMTRLAEKLNISSVETFISSQQRLGILLILFVAVFSLFLWIYGNKKQNMLARNRDVFILLSLSLFYLFLDYVMIGFFLHSLDFSLSNTAYIPIFLLAIGIGIYSKNRPLTKTMTIKKESLQQGFMLFAALLLMIVIFSFISIHAHHGLPGFHERF